MKQSTYTAYPSETVYVNTYILELGAFMQLGLNTRCQFLPHCFNRIWNVSRGFSETHYTGLHNIHLAFLEIIHANQKTDK